jgi:protein SCO1/2
LIFTAKRSFREEAVATTLNSCEHHGFIGGSLHQNRLERRRSGYSLPKPEACWGTPDWEEYMDRREFIVAAGTAAALASASQAFAQMAAEELMMYPPQYKAHKESDAHCVATGNDCLKQQEGAPIFGPFELVDQDGIKVTDKIFADKPSVIFFGYTSCPDFCPTALSELSTWLNALGPNAYKLNVLFISIDPKRDTSAHVKEYLSSFDPRIRGLTGTGVFALRIQLEERGYDAMDHAALIYLMDRAGKVVSTISLQTDNKIAIERLRQLAAL